MARGRLFEFSDQAWLPRTFRDLLTEVLRYQLAVHGVYAPAVPKLNETLRRSGTAEILDLCSGSGGPLPSLRPCLQADRILLSDRYPVRRAPGPCAGAPGVAYCSEPLDARAVPAAFPGCRTLFSSFHHFDEVDAKRVLGSAVEAGAPIAVFEFTDRALASPRTLFQAPLTVWRDSWAIRPRRWARLFWTYLLPVLPLLYAWDALVSHRRSYTPAELYAMTEGFPGYSWETGRLPPEAPRGWITYLVGIPRAD